MFVNGMRPVHAGEVLREEFLVPMDLTANALAIALGVTPTRINEIVREKRGISMDTALRLAKYFGTSVQFWINLQTTYDLKVAQAKLGDEIEHISPHEMAVA